MNTALQRLVIGAWFILASVSLGAGPELPPAVPSLSTALPAGGQRGGTVEVAVSGANLADLVAVRFSGGRLAAEVVENSKPNSARLKVTIPADAELGDYEFRIATRGGVSNCLRFVVGDLREITETEPNTNFDQSQSLEQLPVVVNGQLGSEDKDCYRFHAKAGQRFVFEVCGRRLRPFFQVDERVGWFDPALALYVVPEPTASAAGTALDSRTVAASPLRFEDDYRTSPDPVLDYTFEKDGDYVVVVQDVLNRGRPEFIYRLTVGPVPYVTDYFPPAGQRSSELKVRLRGANVPQEVSVPMPAGTAPEQSLRISAGGLASNPLFFTVGDQPQAIETEPNDAPEQAMKVVPPASISGRIDRPGDVDCLAIEAKKGQRLVIEAQARPFGSPLDAVLQVLNPKGSSVATNDDSSGMPEELHKADARVDYTFPADGNYVVRLRDFLGRGGEEFVYRLEIAAPSPDFELKLKPTDPPLPNPRVTTVQTIAPRVAAGGTALFRIDLTRKDGFKGPVQLAARNLPPGFQLSPATAGPGDNQALLTLTAPDDAAVGTLVPIEIVGTTKVGESDVRHVATAQESHSYITDTRQLVSVREALLSVTAAAPLRLRTESTAASIAQGGKAELKVSVQRGTDVKGPITVSVQGLPSNVTAPSVTIPEAESAATVAITAAGNAPPGVYNVVLVGNITLDGKPASQPAPAVALTVIAK